MTRNRGSPPVQITWSLCEGLQDDRPPARPSKRRYKSRGPVPSNRNLWHVVFGPARCPGFSSPCTLQLLPIGGTALPKESANWSREAVVTVLQSTFSFQALWGDCSFQRECQLIAGGSCIAYSVQRTAYGVQCTAYSIQCTAYSVQCTAYSVQWV